MASNGRGFCLCEGQHWKVGAQHNRSVALVGLAPALYDHEVKGLNPCVMSLFCFLKKIWSPTMKIWRPAVVRWGTISPKWRRPYFLVPSQWPCATFPGAWTGQCCWSSHSIVVDIFHSSALPYSNLSSFVGKGKKEAFGSVATFTPISLSCVQGVCVHYHRRKEYHLLANLGEERRGQILVEAACLFQNMTNRGPCLVG